MSKTLDSLYRSQSVIYKYILYFLTIASIVFFFPRGGHFKYEFQKGKPWQYENLYAPFDFSIRKTDQELATERKSIQQNQIPYYRFDTEAAQAAYDSYDEEFLSAFPAGAFSARQRNTLQRQGRAIMDSVYRTGLGDLGPRPPSGDVYLVRDNEASRMPWESINQTSNLQEVVSQILREKRLESYQDSYLPLLLRVLRPNVSLDTRLTEKELENRLNNVSLTRGSVDEGKLIIAKGEVVEADNLKILESLKGEYESEMWTANNAYFILAGYTILVALVLMMLLLFLKKYRPSVYRNNINVTFIFFNILIMVFLTTLVVKYDADLVYVVPLCILPLILKTFFDARLGLFVHVLTVLILGFVVPNSFEYIFLQIVAGIVTILTVSQLYKRANLFTGWFRMYPCWNSQTPTRSCSRSYPIKHLALSTTPCR
jgi:membrane-associated HD superfamily phosphohydrolase